jgi:hypothetical protein
MSRLGEWWRRRHQTPADVVFTEQDKRTLGDIEVFKRGKGLFTFYLVALFGLASVIIVIGMVACLVVSSQKWQGVATVLAVGWAAWMLPGLFGIIFALPRASAALQDETGFGPNDNLLTISDWLTKILVGFGLAQAGNVSEAFGGLTRSIGDKLGIGELGQPLIGGVILVCAACGFLYGYLWGRLYFAPLLEVSASFFRRNARETLVRKQIEERSAPPPTDVGGAVALGGDEQP